MIRNLLIAAVIGATAVGVGTLYAATEPVQGAAHAAIVQSPYGDAPCASETDNEDAWQACHDAQALNAAEVALGGNPRDIYGLQPQDFGCWVEKVHSVDSAEVICGDWGDRPLTDTADIGQDFGPKRTPWVAVAEADGSFDIVPSYTN